ncbi:MAG: hypothetical protein JSU77_05555 [Fidelibacterota bacterium]|nr:MAG: hypothetical protein JSU77_05555 [Candidatus Neomarinimicrobiota bacterium]
MIRSNRYRRILLLSLAVALCLSFVTMARANINFFVNVMRNLQHYRVSGELVSMDLEGKGTGNLTFNLTLPSRRTNTDEVIMYGYLSTGYAIKRTGLKVRTINVSAIIPSAGDQMICTTTNADLLARVISEEIDPHRFLGEIEWIK